jgi:hypothetical protein
MVDDLVRFGIDLNILPTEEELAELKAKDAEYRKQMSIDGAVATGAARKKYIAGLVDRVRHGDRQASQMLKNMGLNPYTGNPVPKTAVNSPSTRYGAP